MIANGARMRYASMQTTLCAVIIALFLILTEYAGLRKEKVKEMADLIDRDNLKQTLFELGFYPAIVKSALDKAPAVDAVPVVRCRECAIPHNKYTGCPKLNGLVTPPDFYCSYGERRENA